MERVDIKIGFQCNNLCQFCVQGDKRFKFKNRVLKEIKESLDQAKKEGSTGVVFTGGEPTIHPDILSAIKYAKDLGFKNIQIQSNGRMFAYLNFCKELIKAGANEFSPALHSSKPEIHDELTSSPGAWQQVVQGIKNLKALGQYILTNTVINSKNYQDLPDLAQLFVYLGVNQFQFAFVHILGTAAKNKEWIVPKMSEVMPFVKKGLDIGKKAGKIVMAEAIPYCLMNGYENYIAEKIMPETKIVDAEGIIESFSDYRLAQGKAKREECKICKYFKICEGPWKEYPEIFCWDEFRPVSSSPDDFIEIKNYDSQLCGQISDLYDLGKVISVYKYQGHSCNKVHLFEFENIKVILKFTKYNSEQIFNERDLLSKFEKVINFPKLLINKMNQPFFEYRGDLVKVYEFIDGKIVNPEDYLETVGKFINIISEIEADYETDKIYEKAKNEFWEIYKSADRNIGYKDFYAVATENKKNIESYFKNEEKIIPYHNLDLIKKDGIIYILESEHLAEDFFPLTYALSKYLVDIIDKSRYGEGQKLNILETLKIIIESMNFKLNNQNITILKIFLVSELLNRIFSLDNNTDPETVSKFKYFYNLISSIKYGPFE